MQTTTADDFKKSYFRYWGKASPKTGERGRYHLLVFHSLDVAACGLELLRLPQFGAARIAAQLGWTEDQMKQVFVALLALHDVGKFSRVFQGLASGLGPALVSDEEKTRACERHDTMGWVLLAGMFFDKRFPGLRPCEGADEFWQGWFRLMVGHHGRPPKEGGLETRHFFLDADRTAAYDFVEEVLKLLHASEWPTVGDKRAKVLLRLSWQLAGLAVLADWIGSDANRFPYQEAPQALASYWAQTQERAAAAVAGAGLRSSRARAWSGTKGVFSFEALSGLQEYARDVELAESPQLFLLEDVTGAGKTEAGLLLAHRMMAAGRAHGLYFALPTMATANQLYQRVGGIYTKLYEEGEQPSLVLSHGASRLVDCFRNSILKAGERPAERSRDAHGEPEDGSAHCSAWLADSRKKAMLAEVGVGTLDQALLGVLPVRHQSLRLLGLAQKVLIVDEVHAYDAYTGKLLEGLVEAQAMSGGNTILLSATVPASLRRKLVEAYRRGLGVHPSLLIAGDARYPLATQVSAGAVFAEGLKTRPEMARAVQVEWLHQESEALALVLRLAREGRAVCWIRNTVEDARRAYREVAREFEAVTLFHARFAMGDRLRIEGEALHRFGSRSGAAQRSGQVLIATQVVEQSLDVDFDEMVTDLAPIDLLIQRAGRLHRHVRHRDGQRAQENGRGQAVLHVLSPAFVEEPEQGWYAEMFPVGRYVYEDTAKLWLTMRALRCAGRIVSPGQVGERGSIRALVEAVYDERVEAPKGLEKTTLKAEGKKSAESSQGVYNRIRLDLGYGVDASDMWHEKAETPTRLGDESVTIYLAQEAGAEILPLFLDEFFDWEMSAVQVRVGKVTGLAPEWLKRFGDQIETLRRLVKLLAGKETLVLPLVQDGAGWVAKAVSEDGPVALRYTSEAGLEVGEVEE